MQIDVIRYKEDLPPLGMNYIKLGLQEALYDPKTKEMYTPNNKELAKIGGEGLQSKADNDIIEAEQWFSESGHPRPRYRSTAEPVWRTKSNISGRMLRGSLQTRRNKDR